MKPSRDRKITRMKKSKQQETPSPVQPTAEQPKPYVGLLGLQILFATRSRKRDSRQTTCLRLKRRDQHLETRGYALGRTISEGHFQRHA